MRLLRFFKWHNGLHLFEKSSYAFLEVPIINRVSWNIKIWKFGL